MANHAPLVRLTVNIVNEYPTGVAIFNPTDVDQVLGFIKNDLRHLDPSPEIELVSKQKTLVLLYNEFTPYGIMPLVAAIYDSVSSDKRYDRIELAETSNAWVQTFKRRPDVDYAVILFLAAQSVPSTTTVDGIDRYVRRYVPGMP